MKVDIEELKFIVQNVCRINRNAKVKFTAEVFEPSSGSDKFKKENYKDLSSITINFADDKDESDEVLINLK